MYMWNVQAQASHFMLRSLLAVVVSDGYMQKDSHRLEKVQQLHMHAMDKTVTKRAMIRHEQ